MAYVGSTLYPKNSSNTRYGEKTSEHGFYSPDPNNAYGGTNRDGSKWSSTYYKWNESSAPQAAASAPAPVAAPKQTPTPTPKPEPVEHSPEIKQAKERVAKYQDDVLSGKVSEEFYGGKQKPADSSLKDNYTFDLPNNVDTTDNNNFANGTFDPVNKSDEAVLNFLSNKKNLVLNNFR